MILFIETRTWSWQQLAQILQISSNIAQSTSLYVYLSCQNSLREEAERLIQFLGFEDNIHVLSAGESPPAFDLKISAPEEMPEWGA